MSLVSLQFVTAGASDECGCPEEEWIVGGINLTIHIEPEGHVHAFMDGGDWGEAETMLRHHCTLDSARADAFDWASRVIMTGQRD